MLSERFYSFELIQNSERLVMSFFLLVDVFFVEYSAHNEQSEDLERIHPFKANRNKSLMKRDGRIDRSARGRCWDNSSKFRPRHAGVSS